MNSISIVLEEKPVGRLSGGAGVNWFDFFGSNGVYANCRQYPLDASAWPPDGNEEAWNMFMKEIDVLRPMFIRYGIPPEAILRGDGSLDTSAATFKRLDRVCAWAADNGASVMLDPFLIPEMFGFPVNPRDLGDHRMVNMAARDNLVYARDFAAALVRHAVKERGNSAIRWFNPVNEPMVYGCYKTPDGGPDVYRHYVDMYRQLRSELDRAALSDVRLIGIDSCAPHLFPIPELHARGLDMSDYVDAYSIHLWTGMFDWERSTANVDSLPYSVLIDNMIRRIVQWAAYRQKKVFALEYGAFQYGWWPAFSDISGPATQEGCLTAVEGVLRMLSVGVEGYCYWNLCDPNSNDGHWAILQWDEQSQNVKRCGHVYATQRMLMQYGPVGSQIFRLTSLPQGGAINYVHSIALQSNDGCHVWIVNDHHAEVRRVKVQMGARYAGRSFSIMVKDRIRMGDCAGSVVLDSAGSAEVMVTPMSFTVLTTA